MIGESSGASDNFRAALLMVCSMVLFAFEDMFIKLLSADLPFSQVLGLIGLIGWLAFWIMLRAQGGRLFTRDLLRPPVILRNISEAIGSIGIVVALALSDLSSTAAIMQALPLGIVLGAALFLGEPVGWRRWGAIGAGFLGVLLVIRPGLAGFQPVSLMAVVAVLGLTARDVATRRIPAHVPSLQLAASAFLAILLASVAMGVVLGQAPAMLDARQGLTLACCMAVGLGGYSLLVIATRLGQAAALAPFRYARLVFALILALVVFGERPDAMTLIGAAIIVGSGCYAMLREARLRRNQLRAVGMRHAEPSFRNAKARV
ncbi:MAG: DMT family transporter [Paracoccus sp. (in: a-proteobacteria)]